MSSISHFIELALVCVANVPRGLVRKNPLDWVPIMRLVDYRTAVADTIKSFLPSLQVCRPHGGRFDLRELQRASARCPAVFVAALGIPVNSDNGDKTRTLRLRAAAYVVTEDARGLARDVAALNLVEGLSLWLPSQRWGLAGCSTPSQLAAQNLYDGTLDRDAVALWAVTWEQSITGGTAVFADPDAVLPSTVYASWEPKTGLVHQDDYDVIASSGGQGE